MPKRLYIPEWDRVYPPKNGNDTADTKMEYSKKEKENEIDEKNQFLIQNVELEKLTRRKLISLTKDCGIMLKSQYKLSKVEIIRKIRKSKIGENKLRNLFLQYINMYYCEYY